MELKNYIKQKSKIDIITSCYLDRNVIEITDCGEENGVTLSDGTILFILKKFFN